MKIESGSNKRYLSYQKKFLNRLLASSQFSENDFHEPSLTFIREVVYRLFSLTTPLSLIPAVLVSWHLHQPLFMAVQAVLSVIVILHAVLLLKNNYRLLSPVMIFNVSIVLYMVAIYRGEHFVLYWGNAFSVAFYLLLEKQPARFMNLSWIVLNGFMSLAIFPVDQSAYFIGGLATTAFFIEILFSILNRHEARLRRLAVRDPLTNAYNRRTMLEDIEQAVAICNRYQTPASIVMIDVDKFKSINDSFGHQEGDNVLVNLVDMLAMRLRRTDRLYRYGGEEFVAFLASTRLDQAASLAEHFCQEVRDSTLSEKTPATISCGVAEVRAGDTAGDWLARCDAALYRAKTNGRDRIELEGILGVAIPRASATH